MAGSQSYFHHDKSSQADWYTNMATNFPSVAVALGFSTAEQGAWVKDCTYAA